jgi:hypothetical protein
MRLHFEMPDAFKYGLRIYESVEEALKKPASVKRLYLHGDGWDVPSLPLERCAELLNLTINLRDLQIGWQSWSSLPIELGRLLHLRRMTVLNTPIKRFPDFLKACPHLQEITLRGTDITEIPESIIEFRKLRSLDIGNNAFRSMPNGISQLHYLKKLGIADTFIPYHEVNYLRQQLKQVLIICPTPRFES